MSAFQIFTQPSQQALDTAANVLSGATLTFTLTGTSTPTNAYSDSALTIPVSNPLSANAAGVFIPVFLDPTIIYRVVMKTAAGAVLQTWDPANEQILSAALIGFYLYPRTASEITAGVTPVNYSKFPSPWKDISRFVTDNTGATDVTTAFNNALKAEKNIIIPEGTYKITGSLICQDDTNIEGAGYLSTIIKGDLANKSFFRSAYGENPTIGQRPLGIRIAGLGIFPQTASTITAGSIGVNFRNSQYCTLERVLMQWVDTGIVTDQITQYNNYHRVIVQIANTGAYLESIGGGNKLVACDIAGNVCALDMNGGAYDILGGTYEALQTTTTYCIRAGRPGGQTTYFTGSGVYLEGTNAAIIPLQAENCVLGSYFSGHLHSTLGSIVNNAGEELILFVRSYYNPALRAERVAFSSTIGGSELASLRAVGGNALETRNSANSGYGDHYMRNLVLNGAAAGVTGTVALGNTTQSTVGAAGGASALPATPSGYLRFFVGTTEFVLPYYNRV